MIRIDAKILSVGDLNGKDIYYPFSSLKGKTVSGPAPLSEISPIIPSLVKANLAFMQAMHKSLSGDWPSGLSKTYEITHLAMGCASSSEGKEDIFLEYQDVNMDPDELFLTVYRADTGDLLGAKYKKSTKNCSRISVTNNYKKYDGSSIWLVLFPYLMQNSDFATKYSNLKSNILLDDGTLNPTSFLVQFSENLAAITELVQSLVIDAVAPIPLNYPSSSEEYLALLQKNSILNGTYMPTKKITSDNFIVFQMTEDKTKEFVADFEPENYIFPFIKENLTQEELTLVPTVPEDNVVTTDAVELLDEMKATWGNPRSTKITQVFLEGGAGSGKSHLARFIAATLKRPFVSFTCSPNTDEADIKGTLLPVVDTEAQEALTESEKKILDCMYKEDGEAMYNKVAELLGLPNIAECFLDPEGSYFEITGREKENVDSQEAYTALCIKVMQAVKSLIAKSNQSQDGVKYKYIPSNIIRAIQNGWILELQEPSCMQQQGMLSCLFDVLDKDSIGVLNTPLGDIVRHPDFMIIATTNRKYRGTKPLNEAARSRFQYFLKMESPSPEVVAQRIMAKTGLKALSDAMKVAEVFDILEKKCEEINTSSVVTLRGVYTFADAVKRGKSPAWAAERYLIWAATTDSDEVDELKLALEDNPLMRS